MVKLLWMVILTGLVWTLACKKRTPAVPDPDPRVGTDDVRPSPEDGGAAPVPLPSPPDPLESARPGPPEPGAPPPAAPSSARPFTGDPGEKGQFQVVRKALSLTGPAGPLRATLFSPKGYAGGKQHLVIVLHGFGVNHNFYDDYSSHLASQGFIALGLDFSDAAKHEQNALEVVAAIDWAFSPASGLAGTLHPRVATAGHSLGGKIAFYAATLDQRIGTVIGWDPVDSGGPPCFIDKDQCNQWSVAPHSFDGDKGMMDQIRVRVLIFAAPVSMFNPEEHHARRFWEGAAVGSLYVYFPGGSHMNWPGGRLEAPITKRIHTAWLLHHLAGRTGLDPFLDGDVLAKDIAAGSIEVQRK